MLGRGELCALRWANIDLEAAEVLIVRNLFQAAGRLVEPSGVVPVTISGRSTVTILAKSRHQARRLRMEEARAGALRSD